MKIAIEKTKAIRANVGRLYPKIFSFLDNSRSPNLEWALCFRLYFEFESKNNSNKIIAASKNRVVIYKKNIPTTLLLNNT